MSGMPFVRMAMDRRKSLDEVFTEVVFEHPVPEEPQDEVSAGEAAEPVDEPAPVDYPEENDNVPVDDEPEAVSPLEEVAEEILPATEGSGADMPQEEAGPGEPADTPEATETGDPD
jgi:hypothetical protein